MATLPCRVLDDFTGSHPLCSSCFGSGGIELVRLGGDSLWIAYSFLVRLLREISSVVSVHACVFVCMWKPEIDLLAGH